MIQRQRTFRTGNNDIGERNIVNAVFRDQCTVFEGYLRASRNLAGIFTGFDRKRLLIQIDRRLRIRDKIQRGLYDKIIAELNILCARFHKFIKFFSAYRLESRIGCIFNGNDLICRLAFIIDNGHTVVLCNKRPAEIVIAQCRISSDKRTAVDHHIRNRRTVRNIYGERRSAAVFILIGALIDESSSVNDNFSSSARKQTGLLGSADNDRSAFYNYGCARLHCSDGNSGIVRACGVDRTVSRDRKRTSGTCAQCCHIADP